MFFGSYCKMESGAPHMMLKNIFEIIACSMENNRFQLLDPIHHRNVREENHRTSERNERMDE